MNKKLILTAITAALIVNTAAFMPGCASASSGEIKIIYDGNELSLDTAPQIVNDTTLVPMRAVFEAFGAKVKWDGDTQTVTAKKKSKTISMTVGSDEISKNEEIIKAQTAPQIIDGRTMVPVRAISELLGLDVDWNGEDRIITITTPTENGGEEWKNNTGTIDLDTMTAEADGVSIDGNVITISKGGDYTVSGSNDNASIVVNAKDENDEKSKVKLRLSGVKLTNPTGAAINVQAADKLYITLEDGTENVISDGAEYSDTDVNACIYSRENLEIKGSGSLTVNAAYNHGISGKDSVEIGNGNIEINAKNDGIHVNDTMLVSGGIVNITAEGDGISSDEIFDITGGTVNITTTGEVEKTVDEDRFMRGGFKGGVEATAAPTAAPTAEPTSDAAEESSSSKGIKSGWMLTVNGGEINVNSTDHAVHSTGEIDLNSGKLTLASSAGKGISGHENVNLNGTTVDITEATEGIESKQIITMNDGDINITCSDDGLNAGGGAENGGKGGGMRPNSGQLTQDGQQPPEKPDGEAAPNGQQPPERPERGAENGAVPNGQQSPDGTMNRDRRQPMNGEVPQMKEGAVSQDEAALQGEQNVRGGKGKDRELGTQNADRTQNTSGTQNTDETQNAGGMMKPEGERQIGGKDGMGGRPESTEISTEHHIQINGGSLIINAEGDGIDSNGSIVMDGGYVVVSGASRSGNSAIDHDGLCRINGGTLIATGAAGMVENPSGTSGQYVISAYTSSAHSAGELVTICDSNGNAIVSVAPLKSYGHIMFSSSELKEGETYTVYEGGTCTGTLDAESGVYEGGSLEGGTAGASGTTGSESKLLSIR